MKTFFLKGKIIDNNNDPTSGLQINAYVNDLKFINHMVGQATTSSDGMFEIKFNESCLDEISEKFEPEHNVYLVIEYGNNEQLKTKLMRLHKEIEYHIKLTNYVPDPNAIDIYENNYDRILKIITEAGVFVNNRKIDIDLLAKIKLPDNLIQKFQDWLYHYDDIEKNYEDWEALFQGIVITTLKEENFDMIGYDGPQVPRNSWRKGNDNVIIWPRNEEIMIWPRKELM